MMIKEKIQKVLEKSIKELYGIDYSSANVLLVVERSNDANHGDYTTNIALLLAKKLKQKPNLIAQSIISKIKTSIEADEFFSKIEVAGPGFINFFLSSRFLVKNLQGIIASNKKWPGPKIAKDKTIIIDYSAPNIAKPFGVGHLRSTIIGQAVCNMYRFLGYKVISDNHIGDWGTQFGKIIYAVKSWGNWEKIKTDPIIELQNLYIKFHQEAEKNPKIEDGARLWFKKLEEGDREAKTIWTQSVKWSMREFDRIYDLLEVKFDLILGESFYLDKIHAVLEECKKKNIAKLSDGALVVFYPSGITPGILVKSDGASTYLTRDLATLKYRLDKFNPTKIIYHVGNEQALHFRQLFELAKLLGWAKSVTLIHASHGLIRTQEGKFSTRAGRTINLGELIKKSILQADKIIAKRGSRGVDNKKMAEILGIGAIKYTDLSSNRKTDIIFDWQKMFSMEGNSAPYLQYAYARSKSILSNQKITSQKLDYDILSNPLERAILVELTNFKNIVRDGAERQLPSILCTYLYNLAAHFNAFYNDLSVLKASLEHKRARLALLKGFSIVMETGLELLGIDTPEQM